MNVVAVFGSSAVRATEQIYLDSIRLGRMLGEVGLTVVNGGYGGVMEAVSRGAREAGGRVIGITAPSVFPKRSGPNVHLSEEQTAASITDRIHRLITAADATITMPGSIGTVTEFIMAWNANFVARFSGTRPRPQIAVGQSWPKLAAFLASEFAADPSLIVFVNTVEEAVSVVLEELGIPGPTSSSR